MKSISQNEEQYYSNKILKSAYFTTSIQPTNLRRNSISISPQVRKLTLITHAIIIRDKRERMKESLTWHYSLEAIYSIKCNQKIVYKSQIYVKWWQFSAIETEMKIYFSHIFSEFPFAQKTIYVYKCLCLMQCIQYTQRYCYLLVVSHHKMKLNISNYGKKILYHQTKPK